MAQFLETQRAAGRWSLPQARLVMRITDVVIVVDVDDPSKRIAE